MAGRFEDRLMSDPQLGPVIAAMPPAQQQQAAGLIAAAARRAARGLIKPGRTTLWNNYYSVVRFQATVVVVAGVTTLTMVAGTELRPFSYRIGDPLVTAGFGAAVGLATEADTNLVKASETISGQAVTVHGMSLYLGEESDLELAKLVWSRTSVAISMDGDSQRYRLGRPGMLPASGGLYGAGATFGVPIAGGAAAQPPLNASTDTSRANSNGNPQIENFYPFPLPMQWTPSGETDSNFNVSITLRRGITLAETARAGAAGVAAFTPPLVVGDPGSFVDIMCRLHSEQNFARSVNQ
jgi:hypothetical protein